MIPAVRKAANTPVPSSGGPPSRSSTPLSTAPASASPISGLPYASVCRSPRSVQLRTVSIIGAGGRRRGSRSRDARRARRKPGTPITTNATRHPWRSASTPPSQIPNTPPNAMPTE
jgi:hypothetical protein